MTVEIANYNVMIDDRIASGQLAKKNRKTYENRKLAIKRWLFGWLSVRLTNFKENLVVTFFIQREIQKCSRSERNYFEFFTRNY